MENRIDLVKMVLTQKRALEVFAYDPETGVLTRKPNPRCGNPKPVVGKTAAGYLETYIDGKVVLAHRLIWLMQTGALPHGVIDHINGTRVDNRWANLRDVPQRINAQNLHRSHERNKSGLLGVEQHHSGKFGARICVSGRKTWLGIFDTPEGAHAAYLTAKKIAHPESAIALTQTGDHPV